MAFNIPGLSIRSSQQAPDPQDNADDPRQQGVTPAVRPESRGGGSGEDDSVISVDDPEALMTAMLAGDFDVDDEDDEIDESKPSQQKELTPEQQAQADAANELITGLQETVNGFNLPDDFDFDKFNSSDPRDQKEALRSFGVHSAQTTVKAIVPLIAGVVQNMQTTMESQLKQQLDAMRNGMSRDNKMVSQIPQYSNPGYRKIIDSLDKQMLRAGIKDEAVRVKSIKNVLASMPIGRAGNQQSKPQQQGGNIGVPFGQGDDDGYFG